MVPCGTAPPECRTKPRAASMKRSATPERPLPMRCQARRKRCQRAASMKASPARGKCLIGLAGLCRGRKRMRQAQSSLSDLLERQPLVLGAVGLAIGATVAGALAKSSLEDEWVGNMSDGLKADLKERAGAVSQSVREASDTLQAELCRRRRRICRPGSTGRPGCAGRGPGDTTEVVSQVNNSIELSVAWWDFFPPARS